MSVVIMSFMGSTGTAFKNTTNIAHSQDAAATAMKYLGDSIKMAGFYGYTADPSMIGVSADSSMAVANDCGSSTNPPASNWAVQTTNYLMPVFGQTSTTINGVFPCIKTSNFEQHSPLLITRYANGHSMAYPLFGTSPAQANGTMNSAALDSVNNPGKVFIQADPGGGILFRASQFDTIKAAGNSRSRLKKATDIQAAYAGAAVNDPIDISIQEFSSYVYYVRPCSNTNNAGNCSGVDTIPTLVRQELTSSGSQPTMTEVPLVEGIERVYYIFGIDTDNNGTPNIFTDSPAPADIQNIVSIKVSLLVRDITSSSTYSDSGKTYDLSGIGLSGGLFTCSGSSCNYHRKVYSETFQVRNSSLRRM